MRKKRYIEIRRNGLTIPHEILTIWIDPKKFEKRKQETSTRRE